jgi:signal transduction histidine kinase
LAVARTAIDVTLAKPAPTPAQFRGMAVEVADATEQAERLIESLLVLARSDRGIETNDPVDLAGVAAHAIDSVGGAARKRGLRIEADLRPAVVSGDPALLDRLVANLVENAVGHNLEGGWLAISTGTDSDEAIVTVANSGPLIDPADLDTYFEPFRRGAGDRLRSAGGAGLGLAIVKSVVAVHAGSVDATPNSGGGLTVTARLACSQRPLTSSQGSLTGVRVPSDHEPSAR